MNKLFRYYRTHHARKMSLKSNLKDIFDRSCHSADPKILAILEKSISKKSKALPIRVKPLLLFPELYEFKEEVEEVIPDFSDVSSDSSMDIDPDSDNPESDMDVNSNVADSDSSSSSEDEN